MSEGEVAEVTEAKKAKKVKVPKERKERKPRQGGHVLVLCPAPEGNYTVATKQPPDGMTELSDVKKWIMQEFGKDGGAFFPVRTMVDKPLKLAIQTVMTAMFETT